MIRAESVGKSVYTTEGTLHILKGIDLEIKAGEAVAVVGASGSGKSTLLSLLAGLDLPTEGHIALNGQRITSQDEDQRAQLRAKLVGFVFQSFQLLPGLNALENVMLPLELAGEGAAAEQAKALLDKVGLGQRTEHYPRQLSGGEQQRVALARAFVATPKILFADEPTGNLDTETGARVIDLLFELNAAAGTTLVLVTHETRLAQRCQRRIELDGGSIVSDRAAASNAQAVSANG